MKKTKIVCTLGPAADSDDIVRSMMESGMNVARQNFSHGNFEEHKERMDRVKRISAELEKPIAIMLDTKGPEIRIKSFKDGIVELQAGQDFFLSMDQELIGDENGIAVTYDQLTNDLDVGNIVLIDDGLIGMEVVSVEGDKIHCRVHNAGTLKNNKGVNLPGVKINLPAITAKDRADIEFGIEQGVDYIAASFIRKAEDVIEIRKILEDHGATEIQIISKIENQEGVENIDSIIKVSDGIMVARGDLGVEIPAQDVPFVQKQIIRKCNESGKPVITATQMLDSMQEHPRPTRAEVGDVANAILDGTDAVMLSGETAAGKYPVESVQMMAQIALKTENSSAFEEAMKRRNLSITLSVTNAISHATVTTAEELGAKAIITSTSSGHTAREVSKHRPACTIIAVTPFDRVMRRVALVWGVKPFKVAKAKDTDTVIENAVTRAMETDLIQPGDLVVISAGIPIGIRGATNMIKVHIAGEILLKGMGIGSQSSTGRVCIANSAEEAEEKFKTGDILVTTCTAKDMVKYMERAAGIVTEAGGLTSHAAVVGLTLGKVTIVGVDDATEQLKDGYIVTIDAQGGLIYKAQK